MFINIFTNIFIASVFSIGLNPENYIQLWITLGKENMNRSNSIKFMRPLKSILTHYVLCLIHSSVWRHTTLKSLCFSSLIIHKEGRADRRRGGGKRRRRRRRRGGKRKVVKDEYSLISYLLSVFVYIAQIKFYPDKCSTTVSM